MVIIMKNILFLKKTVFIIFLLCSLFLIYSFIDSDIPDFIRYILIFIISFAFTYLYMINRVNKNMEKLRWLENRLKLWNLISFRIKKAGEHAFNYLPVGILVYNEEKVIEWANGFSKEIFMSPLIERKIELINPELSEKINTSTEFDITIYGRDYLCYVINEHNIIYFMDETDLKSTRKKYDAAMLAVGFFNLDNLDSALGSLDPQEKSLQMSNIIALLSEWGNRYGIYLRGFSESQYLMLMTRQQLKERMEDNFKITEEVQSYCLKEDLRITVSFGIACKDIPVTQLVESANTQLMLALNRGGNQGVVSINEDVYYFGAKTASSETRSPVLVRVRAEMLSDLIKKSRNIYIMAHKDMDADAFGASLAVLKMVRSLNKEGKIIFDPGSIDDTIKNIYNVIQKEHINILDYFISPSTAISEITSDSLLIIVDCQYQKLLLNEKIFKLARNVAVIDHHRRNNNAIDKYEYLYSQSSASSAVELIVEMFEYLPTEIEINPIEATWMLMGIIVDTNNLIYRTSYRTFNVLAVLQKYGALFPQAQRFLREDFGEYVKRMSILNNVEIHEGKYGIALCAEDEIYTRAFLAKIADNIISVDGIKASFCIGHIAEDEIGISARSLDQANVQLIMEQLGGGGHFNNAATQIKNIGIGQAKQLLIEKLDSFENGGMTTMRIILTKDVKGKGKAEDIIDIPAGHANFLVRTNQAVLATVDNIRQLEKKRREEKEAQDFLLNEMRELKLVIESRPVKIYVQVGREGKLFGSVSTKQITEEYKAQNNITLDKRKILYDRDIDALGTYTIPIQLHREVTANITVYVVEKE